MCQSISASRIGSRHRDSLLRGRNEAVDAGRLTASPARTESKRYIRPVGLEARDGGAAWCSKLVSADCPLRWYLRITAVLAGPRLLHNVRSRMPIVVSVLGSRLGGSPAVFVGRSSSSISALRRAGQMPISFSKPGSVSCGLALQFKRHSTSSPPFSMGHRGKPGIRVTSIQPRVLANHVLPCQTGTLGGTHTPLFHWCLSKSSVTSSLLGLPWWSVPQQRQIPF
ncbi:uncharacterized protein B0H64DRAFT_150545 [Chaetomium fimeti]|uniref:Uncharacterized protein n=1 Tax=Chaetomium fimeti TaxID=1854472 RepID=A0AAE0LSA7_9PEZI|nr:hypothetical protein B0H64DRAFT_150545 [Chaetomium fimeti]